MTGDITTNLPGSHPPLIGGGVEETGGQRETGGWKSGRISPEMQRRGRSASDVGLGSAPLVSVNSGNSSEVQEGAKRESLNNLRPAGQLPDEKFVDQAVSGASKGGGDDYNVSVKGLIRKFEPGPSQPEVRGAPPPVPSRVGRQSLSQPEPPDAPPPRSILSKHDRTEQKVRLELTRYEAADAREKFEGTVSDIAKEYNINIEITEDDSKDYDAAIISIGKKKNELQTALEKKQKKLKGVGGRIKGPFSKTIKKEISQLKSEIEKLEGKIKNIRTDLQEFTKCSKDYKKQMAADKKLSSKKAADFEKKASIIEQGTEVDTDFEGRQVGQKTLMRNLAGFSPKKSTIDKIQTEKRREPTKADFRKDVVDSSATGSYEQLSRRISSEVGGIQRVAKALESSGRTPEQHIKHLQEEASNWEKEMEVCQELMDEESKTELDELFLLVESITPMETRMKEHINTEGIEVKPYSQEETQLKAEFSREIESEIETILDQRDIKGTKKNILKGAFLSNRKLTTKPPNSKELSDRLDSKFNTNKTHRKGNEISIKEVKNLKEIIDRIDINSSEFKSDLEEILKPIPGQDYTVSCRNLKEEWEKSPKNELKIKCSFIAESMARKLQATSKFSLDSKNAYNVVNESYIGNMKQSIIRTMDELME